MPTEFSVNLKDQPGTLGRFAGVLGDAGVNIEAIAGSSREGTTRVQFVCNAPDRAAKSLETACIEYTTRDVLIVRVLDEPGTLGDVGLVMAKAGINIDSIYVTTRGHLVLGVDDLAGAIQVAGGMAVMTPD
ncbi:MAG TPA: ACT domain-containing protein [Methylomirabilota bacterium]|nr:ACT domain-containing protein [Methylomirabilota bacterium]